MDVHCSSCGKAWDVLHLWHEISFDADLPRPEAEAWSSLPQPEKLSSRSRVAFKEAGWIFGRSVINVMNCPRCPGDAKPEPDKVHFKGLLEDLFGNDEEDGLASAFEDFLL